MKKQLVCAISILAFPAMAFAAVGGVATVLTPGSATTTVPVSLLIPGLIGVDAESEVAFDFGQYSSPLSTATCAASHNKWPPSVTCVGSAGTVHYDPVVGGGVLGTTTTAGIGSPSAVLDDTAVWLAVFCSETTGTFKLEGSVSAFSGVPGITSASNLKTKRSASNNTFAAGFAGPSFTAFGDNAFHDLGGVFTTTFGWTRVDQAVALEFPAAQALAEGSYTATLTYRVTK